MRPKPKPFIKPPSTVILIHFKYLQNSTMNLAETKFCKENNITQKQFYELKNIYKRKGKSGMKQYCRNKRINGQKSGHLIEWFEKECN